MPRGTLFFLVYKTGPLAACFKMTYLSFGLFNNHRALDTAVACGGNFYFRLE